MRSAQFTLFVSVLLIGIAAFAQEETSTTGPHILHAKLKPAAWAAKYVTTSGPDKRIKVNQSVPETVIYDAKGRLLGEKRGYSPRTSSWAASWLASTLGKQPAADAPLLTDFAHDLTTPDGAAFPPVLPSGEPVVVVFGASWCAPCRALKADLEKIPGITILDVDVNQANMSWPQVMEAAQKPAAH